MSVDEKWIWNPETPASVPAGARISAGKSGSVLMSLPMKADVSVNCVPASCMPSPESPQKRIVTDGSVVVRLVECGTAPLPLPLPLAFPLPLLLPEVSFVVAGPFTDPDGLLIIKLHTSLPVQKSMETCD